MTQYPPQPPGAMPPGNSGAPGPVQQGPALPSGPASPSGPALPSGIPPRSPVPSMAPPVAPPPPRPVQYPRPQRFEPVPGTQFGLAILGAPSDTSGPAIGSLITGIGSILVSSAVWCFGLLGSAEGWGGLVAGAFTVLSVLLGLAGLALGWVALRSMKRTRSVKGGRGSAIAGMICGGLGVIIAISGLALAIALSAAADL